MKIKVVAPLDGEIITVGAKRFRSTDVVFMPKTHDLPDGEIITVGDTTLPLRGSVVPVAASHSGRHGLRRGSCLCVSGA